MLLKCTYLNVYWCAMIFRDVSWCLHFTIFYEVKHRLPHHKFWWNNAAKLWKAVKRLEQQPATAWKNALTYICSLYVLSHLECWILRVNSLTGFSSMAVVPRCAIFLLKRDLPLLICQHCSRSIIPQQPVLCDPPGRSLTPCGPTKPSFHTCPRQRLLLN